VHEASQSTVRLLQPGRAGLKRRRCSGGAQAFRVLLVAAALGIAPMRALATDPVPKEPGAAPQPTKPSVRAQVDYFTRRYEPAGFPLIGGSSDIGFQFGVAGTLSYFANGVKPYAWNQDVLLSMSIRSGPKGLEVAQQSYQWNVDYPRVFGTKIRLNPQVAFTRTINQGYFGLGNASSGAPPPAGTPNPDRYHQYVVNALYARTIARMDLDRPLALIAGATYRYVDPEPYVGSKLAADESVQGPNGSLLLYGTRPMSLLALMGGVVIDSRDSEVFTNSGVYHQIGVRFEQGLPFDQNVRYIEAGAILTGFVPVGPMVLAARFIADFQFFHVPFYDLAVAGPFQLKDLPGGSAGIRGVPIGRYLGPIKIVGNVELRALALKVRAFKQHFQFGGDVFLDTGRVWSDYALHSSLDGSGVGLKYGTGAGLYFLWGQAAIFRIEAAYSPDASSSGGPPIGLYVEDGTMF
jgi:hypothetical protein